MPFRPKSHSELMREAQPEPDDRQSAAARGYDRRWRKLRKMQLRREPLCRSCRAQGLLVPATDADHILPKSKGGQDSLDNLQSLCHSCHSKKTNEEKAGP